MNPPKKPQKTSSRTASQGSRRGAFTLVELVVSIGITSVLMLIIFGILSQAMGTWAATLDESDVSQRANKVLDALASDLSSFTSYQGDNAWMEFYKDQATDRFGAYEASTLYFITSTKDGPEDTESFEGELRAIAWSFKRVNLGTTTEPQDSFILSRAVMDAENTFTGPMGQVFDTTDFQTFMQTSLRGGFAGRSLPAWKTIDHGSEVNVDQDWVDTPANIFAADILDIKFSFAALDRAARQRVSIQDKDFAVSSEAILLFGGIRGRNPLLDAKEAALAAAQTELNNANTAFNNAKNTLITSLTGIVNGHQTTLNNREIALEAAHTALKAAAANIHHLQIANDEAHAAQAAARAKSQLYFPEHDALAGPHDVLILAAAAALDAARAAERTLTTAQATYDAAKEELTTAQAAALDALTALQTAALTAQTELDDARTAAAADAAQAATDAAQAITDATEALADAQEALADNPDAAETITDDELRELNFAREQALKDYSRASHAYSLDHYNEVVVPLGELQKAVDAADHDIGTALRNAGILAAHEKLTKAQALLDASHARAIRLGRQVDEDQQVALADAALATAQEEFEAALAAAPADAQAALTAAQTALTNAEGALEDYTATQAYKDAARTHYAAQAALKARTQAPPATHTVQRAREDQRSVNVALADTKRTAHAAHEAAKAAHEAAQAAQALQIALADAQAALPIAQAALPIAQADKAATAADLITKTTAQSNAEEAYTAALNDYNGPTSDALEDARNALAEAQAEVDIIWADIPAADYANRFEIMRQQIVGDIEAPYKIINAILHHFNILREAAEQEFQRAQAALMEAEATLNGFRDDLVQADTEYLTALQNRNNAQTNLNNVIANPASFLPQAGGRVRAATLALTTAQAEVDALSPEPFETTLSPNHTIEQVDITLKLLTSKGAKLARSIPVSGTLAERTAAFDAIVEQHSMTFTRRVNLIGSKLGSK